jgi:hypothetical protein
MPLFFSLIPLKKIVNFKLNTINNISPGTEEIEDNSNSKVGNVDINRDYVKVNEESSKTNIFNFGSPECRCINSPYGYVLNNNPPNPTNINKIFDNKGNQYLVQQEITTNSYIDPTINNTMYTNPYKIVNNDVNSTNTSPYTGNVYNMDINTQKPFIVDNTCKTLFGANNSFGKPYKLTTDIESSSGVTICMNSINVSQNTVNNIDMSSIYQSNNCGNSGLGAASDKGPVTNISVERFGILQINKIIDLYNSIMTKLFQNNYINGIYNEYMIYLIIKTWIRNYDYTSIKNQII